ncbi:actin filament organization protein-like protein App1-like protein [Pseudovirgaria hyperparasitica]|uniref:Actin filament organization protein-like protein App1-like protein n=1 Tax=Pseudovirgaria hyperparasitica TaxID=470096 RepID=A0A6A6W4H1_9PEZI|nr:actin filament organization protein-like protein App1-like protein [Pseudovirgaria hyperparasitica]KAF2756934.1 actin filament organization protein-like protein App1-like protein [Pseudovirgaria hyperparasitica]
MAAAAKTVQKHMQESEQEHITRRTSSFKEVESTMPHLPTRFRDASLVDNLSSYLGKRNPFTKQVDPKKHIVWIFDNTAWQIPGSNGWAAEFVAAYFVKRSGSDVSAVVADIAEKCGLAKGDKQEATIAKRLEPFVDSILPAHTVKMQIAKSQTVRLGPSGRDGISNDTIRFATKYDNLTSVISDALSVECDEMTTFTAGPTGWAVLSDVDDTIKRTLTADPIGILKTTFVDEPEAIPGMPELYAHMKTALGNPPFWYLSASPYNLYTFLRDFRRKYYPAGQMILREASWMNLAGLLTNLTQGTQAYKVDRMEKVHAHWPKRKFIVVGDSTQTDPESYGEMYRKHPDWIKAIFIRKVTGVAAVNEEAKISDERFEKAFAGVPRDVWTVFEEPNVLYAKVDALVKGEGQK